MQSPYGPSSRPLLLSMRSVERLGRARLTERMLCRARGQAAFALDTAISEVHDRRRCLRAVRLQVVAFDSEVGREFLLYLNTRPDLRAAVRSQGCDPE